MATQEHGGGGRGAEGVGGKKPKQGEGGGGAKGGGGGGGGPGGGGGGGGRGAEGEGTRLGNERELNCFDTTDDLRRQRSLFFFFALPNITPTHDPNSNSSCVKACNV